MDFYSGLSEKNQGLSIFEGHIFFSKSQVLVGSYKNVHVHINLG